MDAIKFVKEKTRMCKEYEYCTGCPLEGKHRSCFTRLEENPEENDYDSPRGIAISKAIDCLKDILAEATSSDVAVCYVTDNDAKPLRMAIEALEKQIPKKPTYEDESISGGVLVYDTWICPCCGKVYELDYDDYKYCPECGQAIDWSECLL